MKCDVAIDRIVDSLCDDLDAETARRLDDHLRTCPSCAGEAAELRRLWVELDRIPLPEPRSDAAPQFGRPARSGRRPRSLVRPLGRAAVVLVLLGAGFLAGRLTSSGSEPADIGGRQFLLLIRGSAPERQASEAQLFQEYSDWGARLAGRGALIAAAELADEARWIRGGDDDEALGGFYLIRASDYDEAERIARSSPHVGYGGTVEIRAIARR